MLGQYILDKNGNPKQIDDIIEWGKWIQSADRDVAKDYIGDILISTVFLGLDHNWGAGPPVLWETMIFGGEHDEYQERYSSRADALVGHQKAVELVKQKQELSIRKFKFKQGER